MDEFKQKYFFVIGELKELLRAINPKVTATHYTHSKNGEEYVVVAFENGYNKKICVTADSLKAIVVDVLGEI